MTLRPLFVALAGLLVFGVHEATAQNTVNLGGFRGEYAGRVALTSGTDKYTGPSRMKNATPAKNSLQIAITARVNTDTQSVPVRNTLSFLSSGQFIGANLAPGFTINTPFSGTFRATGSRIVFSGAFVANGTWGTFKGTVTRNSQGSAKVQYAIYVAGSSSPNYTYVYTGRRTAKK